MERREECVSIGDLLLAPASMPLPVWMVFPLLGLIAASHLLKRQHSQLGALVCDVAWNPNSASEDD